MDKFLIVALIVFSRFGYGQAVFRKFYNNKGESTDSAHSYYYKAGNKGRRIDLSHPGWKQVGDSLYSSQDTVVTIYTSSARIRSREVFYEGVLNGSFISYHENGRISEKGIYSKDNRVGYFMSWYPKGIPYKTVQYPSDNINYRPKLINYW